MLILALVFVIVGSLTVLALTNLASNNLLNTANLQGQRNVQYAADGAMDGAIQALRYQIHGFPADAACPSYPPSGALNVNNTSVRVDCSSLAAGSSEREVLLTACLSTAPTPCPTRQAIITAKIHFFDIESDNLTPKQGWTAAIDSWVVNNADSG